MTYRDLLYKATRLCDKGEITLGEQDKIFSPTDGKHRLKFVDGRTPHFKQYKGDISNE